MLLVATTLCACTAIPLSTAAKLASFDERDFATINPDEIRLRVAVPQGYTWDAEAAKLEATIDVAGRSRRDVFRLTKVSERGSTRGGGFITAAIQVSVTTLRLTYQSSQSFRDLQRLVATGKAADVRLNVSLSILTAPKDVDSVRVWVDVMLPPQPGYVVLIDGATVPLNIPLTYGTRGGGE